MYKKYRPYKTLIVLWSFIRYLVDPDGIRKKHKKSILVQSLQLTTMCASKENKYKMVFNNRRKWLTRILLLGLILLNCSNNTQTQKVTIEFQGEKRNCIIEKTNEVIAERSPLLIILHGRNESASFIRYRIKNSSVFTKKGMVVVYPNGAGFISHTWDHFQSEADFLNVIIDSVLNKIKIDSTKIYIAGFSQGGMLAYRMACEYSDRIAAVAIISSQIDSNYVANNCTLQRAVPLIAINSKIDPACPFDTFTYKGKWFNSLQSGVSAWANKAGCNFKPDSVYHGNNYEVHIWKKNFQEFSTLWVLNDGGHAWPQGRGLLHIKHFEPSRIINANEIILEFVSKHSTKER